MQQQRRRPPLPALPISMNNNNLNRPVRQVSRSASVTVSSCSGCSQPMFNPTLSNVLDRLWHPDCVRCSVCRCLLNEQCYSREGKLYCKDDFIKKYIHRCFSCQNLIQSHEFIRRVRAGRVYHADCLVCLKCKHVLQDEDIASLMPTNESILNDMECVCQSCLNPEKKLINHEEDETTDSELSNTVNGKRSSIDQQNNESQTMQNNDKPTTPPPPPPTTTTTTGRPLGRPPKSRQNSTNNNTKRTMTTKTKAVRQKQTTNERKGRPPSTRSKLSTAATVQTRSSNRRNTKTSRYRKRTYSSGSDDDDDDDDETDEEEEEDDDNDTDFTEEEETQDEEKERSRSPATKTKSTKNAQEKKSESESTSTPPPTTTTSVVTQPKVPEPLSLLSGLSSNPMIKSDAPPNFMLPNFPTSQHIPLNHPFPPGFPLQPRLPVPPPPGISQSASLPATSSIDTHQTNPPENESTDRSTSPSGTETSINAESAADQKPSALPSLLEFGAVPPTAPNPSDIRPPTNPYPFPFVTPGPGVPFSPQTAAGMTTFYRPQFNVPSVEINQESSAKLAPKKGKKRAAEKTDSTDVVAQNILDEPSPPKKKARKTNPRGKGKAKKSETDGENDLDEDNKSPPPPSKTKKKKSKKDAKDSSTTDDNDASKVTNGTLNNNNTSQNLLAQMGLMNNSLMQAAPPTSLLQSSSSNSTTASAPNTQQQAQIAAMYNMTPNFGAYNAFPNAYNPSFPSGPYPSPYGFHPAFGNAPPPPGQPFPFIPPTVTSNATTNDKPAPIVVPETRPPKSKAKANATGEKKKPATSRGSKKKSAAAVANAPSTEITENDESTTTTTTSAVSSAETTGKVLSTSETTSTPPPPPPAKRRVSGTESEDFDEQNDEQAQASQLVNSKSGNESDGSGGNADRSSNTTQSTSTATEKKSGRTTIKPQQLEILNKAFDTCSKPNKSQREQLAADTGLNIRVIQVWFQNKRSKERKGKVSKEKETALDDDEGVGEDSPVSSPQPSQPTIQEPSASQSEPSSSEPTVPITTTEK